MLVEIYCKKQKSPSPHHLFSELHKEMKVILFSSLLPHEINTVNWMGFNFSTFPRLISLHVCLCVYVCKCACWYVFVYVHVCICVCILLIIVINCGNFNTFYPVLFHTLSLARSVFFRSNTSLPCGPWDW